MIRLKLIHFKTTAFPVVMILKILKFVLTVTLKLSYCCSFQKLLMVPNLLLRTKNISRAEEWEHLMQNLFKTLQNLKKAGHCLINVLMFLLKFVFVFCFSLMLNFCCFIAECKKVILR